MKNYLKIFGLSVLALAFTACSEDILDEINKDHSVANDVTARYIIPDLICGTAQDNLGGDINTYTCVYAEQESGVHNQLFRAETRAGEPTLSSTYNNIWGSIYYTIRNARVAIEKCSVEPEDKNKTTKGIAELMLAYNSALLTDMWGDTPYSQAALPQTLTAENMNPVLDKQQSIYATIDQLIESAIADLPQGDNISVGTQDLLYNGKSALWLKFAYGLKARLLMRRIARSSDKEADYAKIIEYCDKSFLAPSEQAAFGDGIYNGTNYNPTFDFQWSRDALGCSQSMADKLIERNDPRGSRVYYNGSTWVQFSGPDDPDINLVPAGNPIQSQGYYTYSVYMFAECAPVLLLSYHEIQFLKAEALARLNRHDEAKLALKNAIIAAFANTENSVAAALSAPHPLLSGGLACETEALTEEDAVKYFDETVVPLYDANPVKEVAVQKYIAMWGASGEGVEAYNDIRRYKALNEDNITLLNPGKFVHRLTYGSGDTTTNPNVKEAFGDGTYVYSEPVWWAGGNR